MGFYAYIFTFYAVAFALLAFLPRWWLLLPAGGVATALSVWAWQDVQHADGPGGFIAISIVFLAILGFASGFAARAVLLFSRRFARPRLRALLVLAGFFFGAPALTFAWSAMTQRQGEARRAPPSEECAARRHPARMGSIRLALPLAPNIRFGEGPEYHPATNLKINEHARRFCARDMEPSLTNLNIEFEIHQNYLAVRNSAFCARPRPHFWWRRLCRSEERQVADGFPAEIILYVPGAYDVRRMRAYSADEAALMLPRLAGRPWQPVEGGFIKYAAEHSVYFARPNMRTYLANCLRSRRSDGSPRLHCRVGTHLPNGLGLIYAFPADEEAFATGAAEAERNVRLIIDDLIAPDSE